MKHVFSSLINAMKCPRGGLAEGDVQTGARAQGMPMSQLASFELRLVVGGDTSADLPKTSWGLPAFGK
jgi:hypothetical protein